MSFGQIARFSFAVIILCFAGITASAQCRVTVNGWVEKDGVIQSASFGGDSTLTYNTTTDTLAAQDNVVTFRAPTTEGGIAYILPESPYPNSLFGGNCQPRVLSAEIKGGTAEIVRRSDCESYTTLAIYCDPAPCDSTVRKVWKEVYKIQGDKLVFQKRIDGKIIPAQAERIEWPASGSGTGNLTFSLPGSGYVEFAEGTAPSVVTAVTTSNRPIPHKKKRHHRRTR